MSNYRYQQITLNTNSTIKLQKSALAFVIMIGNMGVGKVLMTIFRGSCKCELKCTVNETVKICRV
jgi:hypothetical protein